MTRYACHDCAATFDAPTDTDTAGCPGCGEMAVQQPAPAPRAYPDCERCGDTGIDPEQADEPCADCRSTTPRRWGCAVSADTTGAVETFGHEPVSNDVDYWGETTDDPPVCARCSRWIRAWSPVVVGQEPDGRVITSGEQLIRFEVAVLWPCTSAIVLGLEPRPTA